MEGLTLSKLAALAAPEVCVLCGINACSKGVPVCRDCINKLQALAAAKCRQCSKPACACTCSRPENARAPFFYGDGVSRRLIYHIKENADSRTAAFFASIMLQTAPGAVTRADCVTFVPRSGKNVRKYGYDQSRLLARETSRLCGLPLVPMLRHVGKGEQKLLSRTDRRKSALKQYSLRDGIPPEFFGQRVLLIDDVTTTGATVSACAEILRKSGAAKSVSVLTLAMTDLKNI